MKKKILIFTALLLVCAAVVSGFLLWNRPVTGEYSSERNRQYFESLRAIENRADANDAVVTVNGEKITVGQIQAQLLTNQYSVESYRLACAAKGEAPDPAAIAQMTQTEQDITDRLIRNLVVRQEAERLKLTASRKEGKQRAEEVLAEVKKLAEDGHADAKEGLAFMTDEMLSRGKSLSAWVDTSAESYRDGITAGNLEAHYKANTKDTILNYEAYVQDLVTKANIKYHK